MSDDPSAQINSGSSSGLRQAIAKMIKEEREKGGEGLTELVEKLIAQERRVAKLESQQSAQNAGESGCYLSLTLNIL